MIGLFGRQGLAATLRQHCPQMTRRRCNIQLLYIKRDAILQYIRKEVQEEKKDVRLVAKRKRKWALVHEAFNAERAKDGLEPWTLEKLKNLS